MNEYEAILNSVANIVAKNEEIEKIKGENFNLFTILDRRTNEVKTHSAFIAELLNPKGSHYLDDTFLVLFMDMLHERLSDDDEKNKISSTSELTELEVHTERHIGRNINKEGGRLDIYLTNNLIDICIENKIYAGEQDDQLERYANFLNARKSDNKLLIYLTLYGERSSNTKLKSGQDYFTLSYKTDILGWLENCMKQTVDLPILRESIKQYIILIKSLTNQATSKAMEKEIHQAIMENINAAQKIAGEFDKAVYRTSEELKKLIKDRITTYLPEGTKIKLQDQNGKFSSLWILRREGEFHVGVESFNGKGNENDSLFIGVLDFNKKNRGIINYKYTWWHTKTIRPIWNKATLFQKLKEFAGENQMTKDKIADEIIEIIKKFMEDWDGYLARIGTT